MPTNFRQFLKKRPLSWSAISSFEYSKDQWYSRYILNEKSEENEAMKFGKVFGQQVASDPTFYPQIPRYPVFEQPLNVVFNKIPLIGFIDSYDPETHSILEYKTAKTMWSRDKAQNHGQLVMYVLALYITYKKLPKKVNLVCVKTKETPDFKITVSEPFEMANYEVNIEMKDILLFGSRLMKVVGEMEEYVESKQPPCTN